MESQPFSNLQKELLKLYSVDLSPVELEELKFVLGKYFAQKASKNADKVWDEKQYSNELIEEWLDEELIQSCNN